MTRYEESGVSIEAGDSFVSRIKELCKPTYGYGVVEGVGQFCSLYHAPGGSNQLIAASTDGVGTKVLLAQALAEYGYLKTIGIDLVGMVVNDIITCGAMPLFVLDYYALSSLKTDAKNGFNKSEQIINGIAAGCRLAGCALIGGETAEMPDMYDDNKFDLAAFAVGMINENDVVGPHLVNAGDIIIGIESSGPHSNGFSLIRKIFNECDWSDDTLREDIMRPTIIYSRVIDYIQCHEIHAMAHITGGGLQANTARVIPDHLVAEWDLPPISGIFKTIQECGNVGDDEMRKVFNCGIGFVLIVKNGTDKNLIINKINHLGYKAFQIGTIRNR